MTKKLTRYPATPVTAKMALSVTNPNVEKLCVSLGNIVLKLFAAIKDESHVHTSEAAAKRKNVIGVKAPTLSVAAVSS